MKIFHFWTKTGHPSTFKSRVYYVHSNVESRKENLNALKEKKKKNRFSKRNPGFFPRRFFSDSRAVYRVARRTGELPQTRRPVAQVLWRRPASRRRRLCNQYVAALPARPPQPLSPFGSAYFRLLRIQPTNLSDSRIYPRHRDAWVEQGYREFRISMEYLYGRPWMRIMQTWKPRELTFRLRRFYSSLSETLKHRREL